MQIGRRPVALALTFPRSVLISGAAAPMTMMPDSSNPEADTPENRESAGADDATQVGDSLSASFMPPDAMAARIEALLFVHGRPISARRIADLLEVPSVIPVKQCLALLARRYDDLGSAFSLQELAQGYQLTTRPEHDALLNKLVREREAQKLSPAVLECLAVIAYKQPISRLDIESIRGSSSDHLVRALLERGFIQVSERDKNRGNAALYGTTGEFLRAFGLKSLGELPRQQDLASLVAAQEGAGEAEVDEVQVQDPDKPQ